MLADLYRPFTTAASAHENAILPVARMVRDEWMSTVFRGPHDKDNVTLEDATKQGEYLTLMLKEPAVSTAFWSLITAVSSLPVKVHAEDPDNPASVAAADFVRDALTGYLPNGPQALIEAVAIGGVLFGFSVTELVFDYPERGKWALPGRQRMVLTDVNPIDSRFVRFDLDPFKRVVGVRGLKANGGQVFGPDRFAVYTHQQLFNNPFGISQFRSAYRAAKMMESAIKLRIILLENFTGPFLAIKAKNWATRDVAMREAAKEARALGYLVCDKEDEVEVMNMAAGSDSEFQAAMDDMRKEMFLAIRWGYLPFTEGDAQAKLGNTTVQKSMTQLGEWRLATGVANVLTGIGRKLIDANIHDPTVGYPIVALGGQNPDDKKAAGDVFKQAQGLGLPLSKRQVQRALDVEEPSDPQDELHDPSKQTGMGGNPFAGGLLGGQQPPPGGGPDGAPVPNGGPQAPPGGGGGIDVDGDGQVDFSGVDPNLGSMAPGDLDKAALVAALDLQAQAVQTGQPGRFQKAINALKGFVGNHPAVTAILGGQRETFSWSPAPTKGGGVKAVGHAEHEGRVLYGADAARALRGHEEHAKVQEQSQKQHATREEAKGAARTLSSKVMANTATVADYRQLAGSLEHLTLAELRAVRAKVATPDPNPEARADHDAAATAAKEQQDAAAATTEAQESPRAAAEKAGKKFDQDYEFARASTVRNLGEDLKGSARHKVNEWRGLAEAEKDGTAAAMMTRDNLLKAEPHKLTATIDDGNALNHLAAHLALQAFPTVPYAEKEYDSYKRGTDRRAADPTQNIRMGRPAEKASTPEQLRKQYYEAYQAVKEAAEKTAQTAKAPEDVVRAVSAVVSQHIRKARGQQEGGGQFGGTDIYNPVANALVATSKRLKLTNWKPAATSVQGRLNDFKARLKAAYPTPDESMPASATEHVMDVIEGDSFNKTFGTVANGGERFNPAAAYVKAATRTGGRAIDAKTTEAGGRHMMDKVKLRGVQYGNTVSDEERAHHLVKSAEAFADLADVLGLPDDAISLGGKLGLAIGARGKAGASAHYEPSTQIINLTRNSGVGTVAHEWGHALDHFLADFGEDLLTDNATRGQTAQGDALTKAMRAVHDAAGSSGFKDRLRDVVSEYQLKKAMGDKTADYWRSPREVFARTFERYVQKWLRDRGRENTYLSGIGGDQTGYGRLWPTEQEVAKMAPAFEALIAEVRKKFKPQEASPPTS